MKQFAVELKRTSYVTIYVDAETKDQAENLAWEELNGDESYGVSDDANWDLTEVSEVRDGVTYHEIATDETRSYGPQGVKL
jgi:hypothetical protein